MKRVILAAVFIVAMSGFAAAQSNSAKQTSRNSKPVVKKSVVVQGNTPKTVLKQEASSNAKSDSTIKLVFALPRISDTTALPPVKKDEE